MQFLDLNHINLQFKLLKNKFKTLLKMFSTNRQECQESISLHKNHQITYNMNKKYMISHQIIIQEIILTKKSKIKIVKYQIE